MQQPWEKMDGMVQVKTFTLPNGQQISFFITAKGPSCFKQSPDSHWEPIGDDNINVAIAMNRS